MIFFLDNFDVNFLHHLYMCKLFVSALIITLIIIGIVIYL